MTKIYGENLGDWQPRLFFSFDPLQTFILRNQPAFSDEKGKCVLEVDAAKELLLLGYAAMRGFGTEWPMAASSWSEILSQTSSVMLTSVELFQRKEYLNRSSERVDLLDWKELVLGDMETMLLHDMLLRSPGEGGLSQRDRPMYWCMLSLMLIDRCVGELAESYGDEREVLETGLRASAAFIEARSALTLAEARRELASAGGQKRHENSPVRRAKLQAEKIWEKNRNMKRADLIRHIREEVDELLVSETLPKWVDEWNRKAKKK